MSQLKLTNVAKGIQLNIARVLRDGSVITLNSAESTVLQVTSLTEHAREVFDLYSGQLAVENDYVEKTAKTKAEVTEPKKVVEPTPETEVKTPEAKPVVAEVTEPVVTTLATEVTEPKAAVESDASKEVKTPSAEAAAVVETKPTVEAPAVLETPVVDKVEDKPATAHKKK